MFGDRMITGLVMILLNIFNNPGKTKRKGKQEDTIIQER